MLKTKRLDSDIPAREAYRLYQISQSIRRPTPVSETHSTEVLDRYNQQYRDPLPRARRPRQLSRDQVHSLLLHIESENLTLADFKD